MKISELPKIEKELALLRQKQRANGTVTDSISSAFVWSNTEEGQEYWRIRHNALSCAVISVVEKEEPKHYDNSKGSLYKFCDEHELNSYEFDIIKRVMRCRKKGLFLEDLEKTKFAIDLYIKEQLEKHK